jgi:hypothetical protein
MTSQSATPLAHLDLAQLARICGGMKTDGFRLSPSVIDRRGDKAIAQDNQTYPGWGISPSKASSSVVPNLGPGSAGPGDLGKALGRDDFGS